MRHQFTRAVALALTLLTIVSLLAGCKDIAKPTVTETSQINDVTMPVSLDTARYGITSVVAQDYLSQKYPSATLSMFPSSADAMLALQSGKMDYVMTSRATAGYMTKRDDTLKIVGDRLIDEACHIAVSKQRPDL
ncbi:MAG: transporter substrate-binding domain-containing protein, partial [Ruthenibacterium sp.]